MIRTPFHWIQASSITSMLRGQIGANPANCTQRLVFTKDAFRFQNLIGMAFASRVERLHPSFGGSVPEVRRREDEMARAVGVEPTRPTFVASAPYSDGARMVVRAGFAPAPRAS